MTDDRELRKNCEGYSDPTAYAAIKSLDRDKSNLNRLLRAINDICQLAGFEVYGRITLRDKKTGKVWR